MSGLNSKPTRNAVLPGTAHWRYFKDNVVHDLFSSPDMPEPAPVPKIPEPTVMPLPDDEETRKKKIESLRNQQQRGGRVSTILSTEDQLG